MNIVICDDNMRDRVQLRQTLERWMALNNEQASYAEFDTTAKLLRYYKEGNEAAVIFMDIFMQNMNGVETAGELRNQGCTACLVFISSSPEFAVDGYQVHASDYIVKPVTYEAVSNAMVNCLFKTKLPSDELLENIVSCVLDHKEIVIPQASINYVEIFNRILLIHCADGSQYNSYGTIKELLEKLNRKLFIYPNRSFIINMNYIAEMSPRRCILKNQTIVLISRLNSQAVRESYQLFLEKQVWEP